MIRTLLDRRRLDAAVLRGVIHVAVGRRRRAGPRAFVTWSAALALAFLVSACTSAAPDPTSTDAPTPRPSTTAAVQGETSAPTRAPDPEPTESITETLPRDQFADPTTIDNRWYPLVPGTQLSYVGEVTTPDGRVDHSITFTVTDLVKMIDGIETVVIHDVDVTDGEVVEAEIAFFAQDDDGNVWLMGEYPEEYVDGQLEDAPAWLSGIRGGTAGILVRANPRMGDPSHSQGWGPAVDFTDRARVFEVDSRTCVPLRCFDGVLVTDEYNPNEPDAHQLKYYAEGVGVVRVGWAGALERSQETLELVAIRTLSADALAEAREAALALEANAYLVVPDVYGQTEPARRRQ